MHKNVVMNADGTETVFYTNRAPYEKVYHKAHLFGPKGVSALCFKKPHAINLKNDETWSFRWEAVTCPRCLKLKEEVET